MDEFLHTPLIFFQSFNNKMIHCLGYLCLSVYGIMNNKMIYCLGYLCLSVYGIMNVAVYFDRAKLINFDSSLIEFVELEDRLFRDKAFSIRFSFLISLLQGVTDDYNTFMKHILGHPVLYILFKYRDLSSFFFLSNISNFCRYFILS